MKEVSDPKSFEEAWNSMGITKDGKKVDINNVVIITHGNEEALLFEDGTFTNAMDIDGKNSKDKKISDFSKLEVKEEDLLKYSDK